MTNANWINAKNSESLSRIWLYRIDVDDLTSVFFAGHPEDVSYFKTDSGVHTAQTYQASAISHQGIKRNLEGRIDSMQLQVGDANGLLQAYLEQYGGLRGCKVTVRQVFKNLLADEEAYYEAVYFVDGAQSNFSQKTITLRLKSKLNILQRQLPRRLVTRNYCPFAYKGEGCWPLSGGTPTAPTQFTYDGFALLDKEYSASGDNSSAAVVQRALHALNTGNVDPSTDFLRLRIKCDLPAKISAISQIEIGSAGHSDANEYSLSDLTTLGIGTSYANFELPLSDFDELLGAVDWTAINWFRVYAFSTDATEITLSIESAELVVHKPFGFALSDTDSCNKQLADCIRHNNTARFGGFPGVPDQTTYIV